MKIDYASNSVIPSTAANSIHVMKMCSALAKCGHDVVLHAAEGSLDEDDSFNFYGVNSNFKIVYHTVLPIKYVGALFYALQVLVWVLVNKRSVVYGRDLYSCFLASFFLPTGFEAHGPTCGWLNKYLFELMLKRELFKALVVISKALSSIFSGRFNLQKVNVVVLHDAADNVNDKCKQFPTSARIQVGYVGHLYKGRGIELVIELANRLREFDFHIVGGNDSDIEYWRSVAGASNVTFHGFVDPSVVHRYRNSFDILLAPYQRVVAVSGGGNTVDYMSPLKIFEYLASGKALVCSDLPVLREVLDETTAILVDPGDVEAREKAILRFKSVKVRNAFGLRAQRLFLEKYTWSSRAEVIVKEFL